MREQQARRRQMDTQRSSLLSASRHRTDPPPKHHDAASVRMSRWRVPTVIWRTRLPGWQRPWKRQTFSVLKVDLADEGLLPARGRIQLSSLRQRGCNATHLSGKMRTLYQCTRCNGWCASASAIHTGHLGPRPKLAEKTNKGGSRRLRQVEKNTSDLTRVERVLCLPHTFLQTATKNMTRRAPRAR